MSQMKAYIIQMKNLTLIYGKEFPSGKVSNNLIQTYPSMLRLLLLLSRRASRSLILGFLGKPWHDGGDVWRSPGFRIHYPLLGHIFVHIQYNKRHADAILMTRT